MASLEERIRYQELSFDRTEPHDDLGFEMLNQYNLFLKQMREKQPLEPAARIFLRKREAYLKAGKLTRKGMIKLGAQVFINISEEAQCIRVFQVKMPTKNFFRMRPEDVLIKHLNIYWRSTPKGRLYFVSTTGFDMSLIFPAHFFDRFEERNNEESRLLAICKFLWRVMQRTDNHIFVADDYQTTFFFQEGAGLGHTRHLKNKNGDERAILYLKTFITRDMLSRGQLEQERRGSNPPPLDFVIPLE